MGWSNYIIIPKFKLIIEVPRDVDNIEDYEEIAIEKAIDQNNVGYDGHFNGENTVDMGDVPIDKITIKDLAELYRRYDIVESLAGMDYSKLLLFWLKSREIEFQIKSEHNIDTAGYLREGYIKITRL